MRISWSLIYLFLWAYRSAFSVIGQIVVSRFTSLGDSGRYQTSGVTLPEPGGLLKSSTNLTESFGGLLASAVGGNPILINIGFQTVAFVGIVAVLRALPARPRLVVFGLTLLPSFSVWSSVASKEAIVVFALGLVLAPIIRYYRGEKTLGLWAVPGIALLAIYKPHFLPAIIFLMAGIIISAKFRQKSLVLYSGLVLSLGILYAFRDRVSELSLQISIHFLGFGSSRAEYFLTPNDVFLRAPEGMFLAFFGPTIAEAQAGIVQMASFLESSFMTAVLAFLTIRNSRLMPVFCTILVFGTLFWILFATYPLGVFNAGSAVRYRTGYEMLIFVLFALLLSRPAYFSWVERTERRKLRPAST